ncbi:DNA polymerase III, subunit gamma and tau [Candidatus Peribacteria bacterium RIFCSPLOWO2_02_FULL_55_36]|nr:MAG: DNA polymerase III, subunit gamma and tau [Candidatus Peribacteria bacterium RIFCSPLOWO2_02_FULL_55_36]
MVHVTLPNAIRPLPSPLPRGEGIAILPPVSLYRKYRPKTFAGVIGQNHIVQTLERAVERQEIAHAYIFSGPRGTGKTSMARILATVILTKGITDMTIRSQILKGIEEENLVDFLEIDAASHTQVENIRDLIEKIQFSPVAASAKVYVIDEVHMLSKNAFNALLKTLEEPPKYAYFILATTELWKIPATIQSRCQRFAFHPLREEDIIRQLQFIADQEHITIDRPALRTIAHHAQGGMRDAIALLDQLRSIGNITAAEVKRSIGESGEELVATMFDALEKHNAKTITDLTQELEERGIPPELFLRECLVATRRTLREAVEDGESPTPFLHLMDTLLTALREVRWSPLPSLVIESAFLSLCHEEKDAERSFFGWKRRRGTDKKKEQEEKTQDTKSSAILEAPEIALETLQDRWSTIIPTVRSPAVRMSLKNCRLSSLEGTNLTMIFQSAFHRDKVAEVAASREIEQCIASVFKAQIRIRCLLEEEKNPKTLLQTDAVDLAQAAAEVF